MSGSTLPRWASAAVARLTRLDELERLYRAADPELDPGAFARHALDVLGVSHSVDSTELARIPDSGPVVIASNHPFGGIDGLAAIAALLPRRPDLLVIGTSVLSRITQLTPVLVPVDNRSARPAVGANAIALRRALRAVWGGRALLLFPAGVVSHLDLRGRCVVDPPWHGTVLRFLQAARAPLVPMHVSGRNGAGFQIAGLVHPALRTALLPREVVNKRGTHLSLRIGSPMPVERVSALEDADRLEAHLRVRVYSLAARGGPATGTAPGSTAAAPGGSQANAQPLAEPVDPGSLAEDVARLPSQSLLLSIGSLQVHWATASRMPALLPEIGRLRELTFRSVGEGTGRPSDLDGYDARYDHLFAWDVSTQQVVGAYRLARMDEMRRLHGRGSLYLDTLFEMREPLPALIGPALELGRSFVRPEYQRSFGPLLALWRGIGEYVGRNPRHTRLIGAVSISDDYGAVARELLLRFLLRHYFDPLKAALVRGRSPVRPEPSLAMLGSAIDRLSDIEAMSELIAEGAEGALARRGMPVLLRQYLKLGGRVLGFHRDASFGQCVDCLMLVDLRRAPEHALGRFMSAAARRSANLDGPAERAREGRAA